LEGRPVDRAPVTVPYNHLYFEDHFAEITGRPWWEFHAWRHMPVDEHMRIYRQLLNAAPFDIVQPQLGASVAERENVRVLLRDGKPFCHDRRTDSWRELTFSAGHPREDRPQESRQVWNSRDIVQMVRVTPAGKAFAEGWCDYAAETVRQLGRDHFVIAGGVVGTLYSSSWYVGLTNLFAMLIQEPDLIAELQRRILERNIETIRTLAMCGGDGIVIDDATATSDMISVDMYERFCLPHVTEMVREVHNLGHKAIVIYFGGVADRLEQIASTGADGLIVETSMKGFVNDIGDAVARIGDRVTMFGNMDPILLDKGSDREVDAEIERQLDAGRKGRGFVMSTGSPITPETPLSRVRHYLETSRRQGEAGT
jgi:uroporphyrinogen-III decarboxylase